MRTARHARRAGAALAFAIVLTAGAALAQAIVAPPAPTRYVTDLAGALSPQTRDALESELRAYEKSSGHQIIVWIAQTTGDVPLESYTVEAAQRWKVGHKGKDDGAVLFVFMRDHKARIEVGYGLEGDLTDATSSRIISDDIVPRMRAGDADGAVRIGAERMMLAITPSYRDTMGNPPPPAAHAAGSRSSVALTIFVFVLIFFAIVMIGSRGGRGRGGWILASGWSGGSGFSGGGFDGGFSGGGGSFGGGGASGGW